MKDLPSPIIDKFISQLFHDRTFAYLELDNKEFLISKQGELSEYGIDQISPDLPISEQVDFLAGILDKSILPLELPFVTTPSGILADIHIFFAQNSYWVIVINAEEKGRKQRLVQQQVNNIRLTHDRQTRILNQYLGKEVALRLEKGLENVDIDGERRNLTILFADLRKFTLFSESSSPGLVFSVLNIYLATMIPIVLNEHGVLDKIIGDEIMVIFGMIPSQNKAPDNALRAAVNILNAFECLNIYRENQNKPFLEVGIGIATGPVSLGVLGTQHRKSITVIGNHVNLAARLQGQAKAKQILIDETTFNSITNYKSLCQKKTIDLKGFSAAMDVYELNASDINQ